MASPLVWLTGIRRGSDPAEGDYEVGDALLLEDCVSMPSPPEIAGGFWVGHGRNPEHVAVEYRERLSVSIGGRSRGRDSFERIAANYVPLDFSSHVSRLETPTFIGSELPVSASEWHVTAQMSVRRFSELPEIQYMIQYLKEAGAERGLPNLYVDYEQAARELMIDAQMSLPVTIQTEAGMHRRGVLTLKSRVSPSEFDAQLNVYGGAATVRLGHRLIRRLNCACFQARFQTTREIAVISALR